MLNGRRRHVHPPSCVLCATAALSLIVAVLAPLSVSADLRSGETSLQFDVDILSDLGIALVAVEQTATPLRSGGLGFRVEASSQVDFDAPGGDFEGFANIALHHAGGFALAVSGQTLRFDGVPLGAAAPSYELALRDATGAPLLYTRSMHASPCLRRTSLCGPLYSGRASAEFFRRSSP